MRRILVLTAALSMVGCATTEDVWEKSGASDRAFNMDAGRCRAQAFSVPGVGALQAALVYNNCMQGQGWQLVERPIRK